MSNKISRRTFLKVTGASAAALGAAAVLGGCQAGDNSSIEVKVGDKISNWNNLAVQLTSVFTLASAPDAEGYEYIAMLITSANRSSRDTFAIGAQNILEIGEAYPLDTPEQIAANTAGYFQLCPLPPPTSPSPATVRQPRAALMSSCTTAPPRALPRPLPFPRRVQATLSWSAWCPPPGSRSV